MDHISFFVSSTFKDMQGERDALHRIVIPEIREFAESYGRSIDFIDLRWGISTDNLEGDVSTNKILSVCLDEIEDCSPYQIVILGERYGWMPSPQQLSETAKQKKFTLENNHISVTELEILYGMWINAGMMDRCIFCMREPIDQSMLSEEEKAVYLTDDEDDKERMRKLKEKITQTPNTQVIRYSLDFGKQKGVYDDFTEKLSAQLHKILEKEWGTRKKKSWLEREIEEEKLMTEQLAGRFSAREAILQELEEHTGCGFVVAIGDDGCGMSSLMAKLGERLKEKGSQVKNIYCGNGFCWDTEQLLKILCAQIMEQDAETEFTKISPGFGEKELWKEKWDELAASYDGEKIYFLIDGIHHLNMDEALEYSEFLPSKGCSNHISFIITTNREVRIYPLAVQRMNRWCDFYGISNCTESDLRMIITSRLKAEHKQIGESVMRALLEHPLIHNMLCMELILQDILNLDYVDFAEIHKLEQSMDGNEAISTYLCNAIRKHPANEIQLINHWIYRAVSILAEHEKDEVNYLYYMMSCLALATNGLSVNELADMADYIRNSGRSSAKYWLNWWEEIRFAKLRRYLGKMIHKTSDGRYVFSHEQIRSALFADCKMRDLVAGPMVYFASLPDESDIKQENLLPAFLLYMTGKSEEKIKEIKEQYFFRYLKETFELARNDNVEIAKDGKRRLNRMLNGIRKSFLYGDGETRIQNLCTMLEEKAAQGVTTMDLQILFFIDKLSKTLNKHSIYEKSIMLSYHIALAKGYEKWESQDETYPRPELKRRGAEIGRYCEWTKLERRGLTQIYTEACEYYHDLRVYVNFNYRIIKPEWDWRKLRERAAHYINIFADYIDLLRYYFCNRIILMDADVSLIENPANSMDCIQRSEKYNKELCKKVVGEEAQRYITRCYVNAVLNTAQSYIILSRSLEGKIKESRIDSMRYTAYRLCEKMIKKLKRLKYIKEPLDLEPNLRTKYFTTLYNAYFYAKKEKQFYVDAMWDIQKIFRNQDEWMQDKSSRDQIQKNAINLMECLLQGYVPSEFQKEGKTKGTYAVQLIRNEGSYMLASGQGENALESIYILYLIRALFIIENQEKASDDLKEMWEGSVNALKEYVEDWKEESGEYIYKLQWLLQWHENFKENIVFDKI